jgi:hypothetical protein
MYKEKDKVIYKKKINGKFWDMRAEVLQLTNDGGFAHVRNQLGNIDFVPTDKMRQA